MFLLCFKGSLTASSYMPVYVWEDLFTDSPKKGFLNCCTHTSVYLCKLTVQLDNHSAR